MIEIYTKSYCPFCWRAKDLLNRKKLDYIEMDVERDSRKWDQMVKRSGKTTVPQIIINGKAIGGFDELYKLEKNRELEKLLD